MYPLWALHMANLDTTWFATYATCFACTLLVCLQFAYMYKQIQTLRNNFGGIYLLLAERTPLDHLRSIPKQAAELTTKLVELGFD